MYHFEMLILIIFKRNICHDYNIINFKCNAIYKKKLIDQNVAYIDRSQILQHNTRTYKLGAKYFIRHSTNGSAAKKKKKQKLTVNDDY